MLLGFGVDLKMKDFLGINAPLIFILLSGLYSFKELFKGVYIKNNSMVSSDTSKKSTRIMEKYTESKREN